MKKQEIYLALHQYKNIGYSCLRASELLKTDYKAARKYWKMSPDTFDAVTQKAQSRRKKADIYRDDIIAFLKENPSSTTKQVASHICRKYRLSTLEISERAFQMYVKQLRTGNEISVSSDINPYKKPKSRTSTRS